MNNKEQITIRYTTEEEFQLYELIEAEYKNFNNTLNSRQRTVKELQSILNKFRKISEALKQ